MQIYYQDYNSDTLGNTPSGWEVNNATYFTPVITNTDVFEGAYAVKLKKEVGSPTGDHWFALDTVTDPNDGDAEFEAVLNFIDDATMRSGVAFRGQEASPNKAYVMMLRGGNSMRFSYINGQSETTKSTVSISSYSTGVDYHVKAYANGSTIKGRYWADGDAEPATWTIDTTDATLDNTNTLVGAYLFNGSDNGNAVHLDALKVTNFVTASAFVPKVIVY